MDDLLELVLELVFFLVEVGLDSSDNKKRKKKKNYYKSSAFSGTTRSSSSSIYQEREYKTYKGRKKPSTITIPAKKNTDYSTIFKDEEKATYKNYNDSQVKEIKENDIELPKPDKNIKVKTRNIEKADKLIDEVLHVTPTADAIKIQVMLLTYMVYEDDGRIDFKERAIIKGQLSKNAHLLTDNDILEIRRHENMLISINSIRAYIKHNNISGMSVTKAISFLKEIEREANKYHEIIGRIESALIDVMGF